MDLLLTELGRAKEAFRNHCPWTPEDAYCRKIQGPAIRAEPDGPTWVQLSYAAYHG